MIHQLLYHFILLWVVSLEYHHPDHGYHGVHGVGLREVLHHGYQTVLLVENALCCIMVFTCLISTRWPGARGTRVNSIHSCKTTKTGREAVRSSNESRVLQDCHTWLYILCCHQQSSNTFIITCSIQLHTGVTTLLHSPHSYIFNTFVFLTLHYSFVALSSIHILLVLPLSSPHCFYHHIFVFTPPLSSPYSFFSV